MESAELWRGSVKTMPSMPVEAIHSVVRLAAERGQRIILTTADRVVVEGTAKWNGQAIPRLIGLVLADGHTRWFHAASGWPRANRVVHASIIAATPPADGWLDSHTMTIEQAKALDGKLVEVDTTRVTATGLAVLQAHGKVIRVRAQVHGELYADLPSLLNPGGTYNACVWHQDLTYGTRFRVVEQEREDQRPRPMEVMVDLEHGLLEHMQQFERPLAFERPRQVTVSVRVSGYNVDVEACKRAIMAMGSCLTPGSDVAARQIEEAVAAAGMTYAVAALMRDGGGWQRGAQIGAHELAVFDVDRMHVYDIDARPIDEPLIDERMRQFRRIAGTMGIALPPASEQPATDRPTQSRCPACNGAGTQLLISACPECRGTGSVTPATEPRYTYSLHETFRDGDQVWAIKYGDNRGSAVAGYVLTAHEHHPNSREERAMYTRVYDCTKHGRPLPGRDGFGPGQPGSFLGEHHGERAVAGYVEAMNDRKPDLSELVTSLKFIDRVSSALDLRPARPDGMRRPCDR